jgi:hypothetical protein
MKKALTLNTDWQEIEKHLREDFGYGVIWHSDSKEHALEWCRTHKVNLIVGAFHMGIAELSGSLVEHMAVSGSDFATNNPKILLTWHSNYNEDRVHEFEILPEVDENGEFTHPPHPAIVESGIPAYRKPFIGDTFVEAMHSFLSGSL